MMKWTRRAFIKCNKIALSVKPFADPTLPFSFDIVLLYIFRKPLSYLLRAQPELFQ